MQAETKTGRRIDDKQTRGMEDRRRGSGFRVDYFSLMRRGMSSTKDEIAETFTQSQKDSSKLLLPKLHEK